VLWPITGTSRFIDRINASPSWLSSALSWPKCANERMADFLEQQMFDKPLVRERPSSALL
jgi:hypothetical protein